jgi:hypothetical protein
MSMNSTRWLYFSGAAFIASLLVVSILMSSQVAQRSVFFVLLVVLGLLAAAVLFGMLRSHARWKGKVLNGMLELGGPAVVFVGLIILGAPYAPKDTGKLVVRLYDTQKKAVAIGRIQMHIGAWASPFLDAEPNLKEFVVDEIPSKYVGRPVSLEADVPGYQPVRLNSAYPGSGLIEINLVEKPDVCDSRGTVSTDAGRRFESVDISLAGGKGTGSTNKFGQFEISLATPCGRSVDWTTRFGDRIESGTTVLSNDMQIILKDSFYK